MDAFRAVGLETEIRDVWKASVLEAKRAPSFAASMTESYGRINIFHINSDEIEPTLERLGPLPDGHNVIVPFWELSQYPRAWIAQLERFDEIWAASGYIRAAIESAVRRPVVHMPLPTEIAFSGFLGRRRFGIPENSYCFLFFFDCRSYIARKNPHGVVECFRRLLKARPWARTSLVIKLHGSEAAPVLAAEFLNDLSELGERVLVIDELMSENEVHNLIRCCDAFVSLHRAEGYGLGIAEAMFLGLPVIATGYSGNMDFMTMSNSIPIRYHLIPVKDGEYPHSEDQQWADPDLEQATHEMILLLDDPHRGRTIGWRGSQSIRLGFSYRAAGLRYAKRINELVPMLK